MISVARRERETAARAAQSKLAEESDTDRVAMLRPRWFNAFEEVSGKPDDKFDYESIVANRAAATSRLEPAGSVLRSQELTCRRRLIPN
jgi:hypothetical protein